MPIYAYKCESCGKALDVLQKISDDPLTVCPSCAQPTFKKQVTAAGFQLKGSGWYATDFKGSGSAPVVPPATPAADGSTASPPPASPAPAAEAPSPKTEAGPGTPAASGA